MPLLDSQFLFPEEGTGLLVFLENLHCFLLIKGLIECHKGCTEKSVFLRLAFLNVFLYSIQLILVVQHRINYFLLLAIYLCLDENPSTKLIIFLIIVPQLLTVLLFFQQEVVQGP